MLSKENLPIRRKCFYSIWEQDRSNNAGWDLKSENKSNKISLVSAEHASEELSVNLKLTSKSKKKEKPAS